MEEGYLIIETHPDRPGLVCIREEKYPPNEPEQGLSAGPRIRYVARFNDLSAAQMQIHTRLHRTLVDIETGLYRSDPIRAVAAADSLALRHWRVFLDPKLAGDMRLEQAIEKNRGRHRIADRFWQIVGLFAIVLLLFKLLFGF